jgi:signal transduction histidine kinase/CRP-like cAMP-binding protein
LPFLPISEVQGIPFILTAQLTADELAGNPMGESLEGRSTILKAFPLFSELLDAELNLLAQKMEALTLPAQTPLLTQNQDADAVYFLTQGAVKILVNGEMVAQIYTVQCFGEMSCLVPGTPASASVVTAKDCQIFKVSKATFLEVVNQIPRLWKTLFLQMNGRFKAGTMRLSEVLEHTPQGLIKVDRQGVITNEYSIQCTQYFGKDNLSGIPFAHLIHPGKSDLHELWGQTYPMLFDESGTLTFSDIAELLDRELSFTREDGSVKEFVFSYYPCRTIAGKIEAIDIGIEDVTEARELERKNLAMISEQAAMSKIYENPESFLNLKTFIVQTLSASISYLNGIRTGRIVIESEATKDYLRKLHSLKGYAGVFALKPVQDATHHLEDLLKQGQQAKAISPELLKKLVSGLAALKETYVYTETIFNKIGESLRKRLLGVAFTQGEFHQLKKATQTNDMPEVIRLTSAVEKIDSLKLIANWPEEAAKLALSLEKEVEVTLEGSEGGSIPKRVFEDLDSVLIQLLRNALAHAIEMPAERTELGKPPHGSIRVRIDADEKELRFEIQDDGRGIDFAQIIEQATSDHRLDRKVVDAFVAAGQPWRILFLTGFTTTTEANELSGRGVGLSVVRTMADSYGGSIEIETAIEKGTTFKIKIPLEAK